MSQVLSVVSDAIKGVYGHYAGQVRQTIDESSRKTPISRPVEKEDRRKGVRMINQGVRADIWAFSGMRGVRVGRSPEERSAAAAERHKDQAAKDAAAAIKKMEELKIAYEKSVNWLRELVTTKPMAGRP